MVVGISTQKRIDSYFILGYDEKKCLKPLF